MSDPTISTHFSYAELTRTGSGLPNVPDSDQLANLQLLAQTALEPARVLLGPLTIDSGFRSPLVNAAAGSTAKHSAHLDGLAADFVPLHDLDVAFRALQHSNIPYDQLIREPGWIHIGIAAPGTKPRRQCLIAQGSPGHWTYANADQ